MKKVLLFSLLASSLVSTSVFSQQDKSKRPSPPDSVTQTVASGLTITINYSQPSVKGRTLGKEIAPYGKVWRTGANEATAFEISKDALVEGQPLSAGKYGLYTIPDENEWTVIINKGWSQSGLAYKEGDDVLRVKVKPTKAAAFTEKMTFTIDKTGKVSLLWADTQASFTVK
jgi:hypothetical protein